MKKIFCLILISMLATACGSKGQSQTSFKIFSGNLVATTSYFPGGILVMGRAVDDSQSFIVAYTSDLELDLKKGDWEFATIGWMGSNPLEGNQQCAYQRATVDTDSFTLSFNMSYQNCATMQTSDGKGLTDPLFYNAIGGTLSGFKKLSVSTCPSLSSNCSSVAFHIPASFSIKIPSQNKGITSNVALNGLVSNCNDLTAGGGGASNLTPPYGGHGFIGMDITYFSGSGCSGIGHSYHFDHGFGERLDRTYVDSSGVTQTRRGALSLNGNASDSTVALLALNPKGTWSSSNGYPAPASSGDLYMYTGTSNMPPMYVPSGNLILYNGSSWSNFAETPNVKLILEEY